MTLLLLLYNSVPISNDENIKLAASILSTKKAHTHIQTQLDDNELAPGGITSNTGYLYGSFLVSIYELDLDHSHNIPVQQYSNDVYSLNCWEVLNKQEPVCVE